MREIGESTFFPPRFSGIYVDAKQDKYDFLSHTEIPCTSFDV